MYMYMNIVSICIMHTVTIFIYMYIHITCKMFFLFVLLLASTVVVEDAVCYSQTVNLPYMHIQSHIFLNFHPTSSF